MENEARVIGDMRFPSFLATNGSEQVNCLPGNSVSLFVNQLFSEVPAALTFCVLGFAKRDLVGKGHCSALALLWLLIEPNDESLTK